MDVMAQAFRGDQPMHPTAVRADLVGLCGGDLSRAISAVAEIIGTGRTVVAVTSELRFEVRPCR